MLLVLVSVYDFWSYLRHALQVVSKILEYQKWPIEGAEYALMVNNMGTASSLELGCLLYSAAESLQSKGVSIARMYNGTFMTATDMSGFSISLMRLKQKWKQLLDLEAQVKGDLSHKTTLVMNFWVRPGRCFQRACQTLKSDSASSV